MKRLRSYGEGLDPAAEKAACRDWGRRDQDFERPSSHRHFYSKPAGGGGRKGFCDDERDRNRDRDREAQRGFRKRFDHDSDGFDRRKGFDRYDRPASVATPRGPDRIHRPEGFVRRVFPKGFRSERDRPRRDDTVVSAWRRSLGIGKEFDEGARSDAELGRGRRVASEDRATSRSSPGFREFGKSPQRSRDSGSVQSKCPEGEKAEAANKRNGIGHSEIEEGELEPEPQPQPQPEPEPQATLGLEDEPQLELPRDIDPNSKCKPISDLNFENEVNSLEVHMIEIGSQNATNDESMGLGIPEAVVDRAEENDVVPLHQDCVLDEAADSGEAREDIGSGDKMENIDEDCTVLLSTSQEPEGITKDDSDKEKCRQSPLSLDGEQRPENDIDLGNKEEGNSGLATSNMEDVEDVSVPKETSVLGEDRVKVSGKDKGKGLAVLPSQEESSMDKGRWMMGDLPRCEEDDMEGPSSQCLDLFFYSDIRRAEKMSSLDADCHQHETVKMEPLELSLGLPNVSSALASADLPNDAPSSPSRTPKPPSHARSSHSLPYSFCTSSGGFTTSMSLLGSQTFIHYPSCSLTQNSFENYEQSVGSRPIFQGVDLFSNGCSQGQALNELKCMQIPGYQKSLENGKGSLHTSQASEHIFSGQAVQGAHPTVSVGSGCDGFDCQLSFSRFISEQLRHEEVKSPTHSAASREIQLDHSKGRKEMTRERSSSSLCRTGQREMEQHTVTGYDVAEKIIAMIISNPIQIVARRVQEMTEQSIAHLKRKLCEMMQNGNSGQLHALQEALKRRTDLTQGSLRNCHRAQLEIFVAVKTSSPDFLLQTKSISSSDLVEVLLNLKCRNLACQSFLPVDECDCKTCIQKNGFCSACMCLVCSKFDLASNTCCWVGCDICLHWCHTDCGLRGSHIRNGLSVNGAQGTTQMQFHCIACDHPSEMFGFVKEVFKTCAKEWNNETFTKELEYVKRIFHASEDVKGRQLHSVASQMLEKLKHEANLSEVYDAVMMFLAETDPKFGGAASTNSSRELSQKSTREGYNDRPGPSQEVKSGEPVAVEKLLGVKVASTVLPHFDRDWVRRQTTIPDAQLNFEKTGMDELESIVRIKQAEANMFQARADDARQEAEGLKRISIAKSEKIEEEFANKIRKLQLVETEERRRRKLEELQAFERARGDYFNMKKRMEAEIKDLLLKMEAMKHTISA